MVITILSVLLKRKRTKYGLISPFIKDNQMTLCTVLGKNMKYNNEII